VLEAAGFAAIGLFVAAFAWLHVTSLGFINTDTFGVLDGVGALDRCLHAGLGGVCDGVGRFPLLQYLPALAVKRLGGSYQNGLSVLVGLNGLAFAGLLVIAWRLGRALQVRYAAMALALGLIASPLIWYSDAGFGEGIGAFLIALYTYALIRRARAPILCLTLVLAGITKETALVFLLAIPLLIEWNARVRGERRLTRQQLLGLLLGVILVLALNLGFNFVRYGGLTNSTYLESGNGMPLRLIPEYFVGLLVSPTGGMIFMWPLVLVALGATVYWATRTPGRSMLREPAVGLCAFTAALLVSFAAWHGPFGGSMWGSRLITPWMPAIAMLAIAFYPRELEASLARIAGSAAGKAALVSVFVLLGLAHLSVTVDSSHQPHFYPGTAVTPSEVAIQPFLPDRACPGYPDTPGTPYYFHCLNHWTWHSGWALGDAYRALDRHNAPSYALLYILATISAVFLVARRDPVLPQPGQPRRVRVQGA
jgi:hypothetical protein